MGGYSFEGVAMRKLITDFKAKRKLLNKDFSITVMIDGMAASAATLPILAGDKIVAALGSELMIHRCWQYTGGNAKQLRQTADELERMDVNCSELYAAFCGKEPKEMYDLMDAETYFNPQEAKAAGLVTHVEEVDEATVAKSYKMAGYDQKSVRSSRSQGGYSRYIASRVALKGKEGKKEAAIENHKKVQPLTLAFLDGSLTTEEFLSALERTAA
jgi:ATP-dependent protease ClpP protease subunit